MKQLIVLFLFCLTGDLCWAKFTQSQGVVLLNTVEEGESLGSLEKLLEEKEQYKKELQLVGLARKVPMEHSHHYLFQIVWTGVQHQKEKTRQVVFEKPMISTLKTTSKTLKKGQRLPIEGEPEILLKAVQQLETGKSDKAALKRKQSTENPSTKGRFVEVEPTMAYPEKAVAEPYHSNPQVKKKEDYSADKANANSDIEEVEAFNHTASGKKKNHNGAQNAHGFTVDTHSQPMGVQTGIQARNMGASNTGALPSLRSRENHAEVPNTPVLAPLADRPLKSGNAPESAEDALQPEITYDVTQEGCQPTIDRPHGRVIIQKRTRKFENGTVIEEGVCADSLEMYPIFKDFLCEGCTDEVDMASQRAYARFKEYWLDKTNQRQDLGNTMYTDLTRPFVFRDETGACLPFLDLHHNLAYPQVETLYYNLHNARMVVQGCHSVPNEATVPIVETTHRCPIIHDFANNVSREQKRLIFTLGGLEREALACRPVGDPLPHEFDSTGCRPITTLNGHLIEMVKRKIRTTKGAKTITEECEPAPNSTLQITRDGCEGEYFHDLPGGRSYLKKRYFYLRNNGREYVSACLRTDEWLAHQLELNGYEHDDAHLRSTPKFAIYIESPEQGRLVVDPAKVRGNMGQTQYTFLRSEQRPTNSHYYEGCYKRTRTQSFNLYTRADGSSHEQLTGAGNPIAWPVDECSRTTEYQRVVVGRRGGNFWRHGRDVYGTQSRVRITYPNGHVEYTAWQ